MARPSKGDRHTFVSRVPAPVAQTIIGDAQSRDCSYSEWIAAALSVVCEDERLLRQLARRLPPRVRELPLQGDLREEGMRMPA